MDVVVGDPRYFIWRDAVAFGKVLKHKAHESTLVALATVGHWSHVRTVGLKHDAAQWHHGRQVFSQMTALER